jgi:prepilin peptidase CpaA
MTLTISTGALLTLVGIAAFSDLRERRIPNAITLIGLLVALGLRAVAGPDQLFAGLGGLGVALVVVLPLFAVRGMGGGDAKLLMMVGAFFGAKGFLVALLATAVFGGLLSVVAAARRQALVPALVNTAALGKWVFTGGRRGERRALSSPGVLDVPYGLAIALGSLVAVVLGGGL